MSDDRQPEVVVVRLDAQSVDDLAQRVAELVHQQRHEPVTSAGGDPARNQERPAAIDTDSRREFINNILAHDALLDEVDALLFEHVVEDRQAAVAAELRRLTLAAVTAATPADWQHIAERLIADIRELEADARHNPKTDPPRSTER